MTAHALLTRRMLLKDMGRAGLAVMVLGTAACAAEPSQNATPTEEPGTSSTTANGVTSTSGATTTAGAGSGHRWHRADLEFVSAYILYRGGEAALVDTGVQGSDPAIERALAEVDLDWDAVGHVILTHKHPDHQGSIESVIALTDAPWYAGRGDLDAITATTPGTAVGDGDTVFDLEIIATPGHTPGHLSVLDGAGGVLVAGDALNESGGVITGPNPDFTEDLRIANASVVKLAGFDYEVALFGHGEPVTAGASDLVAELASDLQGQ